MMVLTIINCCYSLLGIIKYIQWLVLVNLGPLVSISFKKLVKKISTAGYPS